MYLSNEGFHPKTHHLLPPRHLFDMGVDPVLMWASVGVAR